MMIVSVLTRPFDLPKGFISADYLRRAGELCREKFGKEVSNPELIYII